MWWDWSLAPGEWFATLRFWLTFVRIGTGGNASPIATFTQTVVPTFHHAGAKGNFDYLPVSVRAQTLDAIAVLDDLGRDHALAIARSSGIHRGHLRGWLDAVAAADAWSMVFPSGAPPQHRAKRHHRYGLGHPRPRNEVFALYRRLLASAGR